MDIDPETVEAMQKCVTALREVKEELRSSRSASTIQRIVVTNEAKSDTPWLMHAAVTSAIVSMVLTLITLIGGGMLYLNMKDHLDAIYMIAPQLQPPHAPPENRHETDHS